MSKLLLIITTILFSINLSYAQPNRKAFLARIYQKTLSSENLRLNIESDDMYHAYNSKSLKLQNKGYIIQVKDTTLILSSSRYISDNKLTEIKFKDIDLIEIGDGRAPSAVLGGFLGFFIGYGISSTSKNGGMISANDVKFIIGGASSVLGILIGTAVSSPSISIPINRKNPDNLQKTKLGRYIYVAPEDNR